MGCIFKMSREPYKAARFTALEEAAYPLFVEACGKIDVILYNAEGVSLEGLNSGVLGRAFVAITDTFVGLLNTFKTNLTKFTKPLKRSELREWVESNRLKTFTVDHIDATKLPDIEVNIPAQMRVSFLEAVKNVALVYKQLDAANLAKLVDSSLKEIFNAVSSKGTNITSKLAELNTAIQQITKASKPTVIECQRNFTGKFNARRKYQDVYIEPKQFKAVTDNLLELEPRLQDVRKITELVSSIEQTLNGICTGVSQNEIEIGTKELQVLGDSAKQVALVFDSYGLASTKQMTLEHNHILNYNIIFAQAK